MITINLIFDLISFYILIRLINKNTDFINYIKNDINTITNSLIELEKQVIKFHYEDIHKN